jgi:hypothetical protein
MFGGEYYVDSECPMSTYEQILQEIEDTLGVVPDFMQGLPPEVIQQEWPLIKKYAFGDARARSIAS